jgi:DNA-directed RNA polymerase subunit M/transcription elongation factor TFIIS
MLLPKKVGRGSKLICPRCGYKGKLRKPTAYKISEKGKEAKEVAVIEEKGKKKKRPPEREFEIEPPEYYENLYE